jgi:hypothetical protein
LVALTCGLLSVVCCRSILDITPGRPLEDASGGAGNAGRGGKTTSEAGSNSPVAGVPGAGEGGAGPATSGGANDGGFGQGGDALAGQAGENNATVNPFPEGPCRDCMARDCPVESDACTLDASCVAGIAEWQACTEADGSACVTAKKEPLEGLERCGAKSCDLCRHLTDDAPTVEILTPSNGAELKLDAQGLIEVSVRVRNFTVKGLGQCGTNVGCGHIHLNLDGANCQTTPFYNQWIFAAADDGSADAIVTTSSCKTAIVDRPLQLVASLSDHASHADRVPNVQSAVTITVTK